LFINNQNVGALFAIFKDIPRRRGIKEGKIGRRINPGKKKKNVGKKIRFTKNPKKGKSSEKNKNCPKLATRRPPRAREKKAFGTRKNRQRRLEIAMGLLLFHSLSKKVVP